MPLSLSIAARPHLRRGLREEARRDALELSENSSRCELSSRGNQVQIFLPPIRRHAQNGFFTPVIPKGQHVHLSNGSIDSLVELPKQKISSIELNLVRGPTCGAGEFEFNHRLRIKLCHGCCNVLD